MLFNYAIGSETTGTTDRPTDLPFFFTCIIPPPCRLSSKHPPCTMHNTTHRIYLLIIIPHRLSNYVVSSLPFLNRLFSANHPSRLGSLKLQTSTCTPQVPIYESFLLPPVLYPKAFRDFSTCSNTLCFFSLLNTLNCFIL